MVPTDQTPDTTPTSFARPADLRRRPPCFEATGHRRPIILATRPAEGGESQRAHPQSRFAVASREGHSLTGVTSTSGGPVVREGGRAKDVISPCPVRPARPLACERRAPKRAYLSGPEAVVDLLPPSLALSLAHPLTRDPWLDFAGQRHPPSIRHLLVVFARFD